MNLTTFRPTPGDRGNGRIGALSRLSPNERRSAGHLHHAVCFGRLRRFTCANRHCRASSMGRALASPELPFRDGLRISAGIDRHGPQKPGKREGPDSAAADSPPKSSTRQIEIWWCGTATRRDSALSRRPCRRHSSARWCCRRKPEPRGIAPGTMLGRGSMGADQ